jgi:hypothetical protein
VRDLPAAGCAGPRSVAPARLTDRAATPVTPGSVNVRRPTRDEVVFWVLVAGAAVAFLFWIHDRDSTHDRWDWSDWLEGTFASACGGFVVVGTAWVAGSRTIGRLSRRASLDRRGSLRRPR